MATTHPAKLTEGSPVRLADREPNAADSKSGLYYPYYRNLTGIIAKLYADETATVMIDPESLPSEIRARHQAGTDAMRQKWLDGLSDEARNKLSASEKKFSLRYNLLVGLADLFPGEALAAPPPALAAPAPTLSEPAAKRGQAVAQASLDIDDLPATPRKSLEELDADEARYLAERAAKKDS
ncbi:MAG: hypothetical protein M3Y13_11325 [Armatimonadota bacterium]|nr:hypothetical protein [Armatimonadota bacterium]